jgi:uncharacterized protein (TIGR03118 family)
MAALTPILAFGQHFTETVLVSNFTQAPSTSSTISDANLQNAWGLSGGYNPPASGSTAATTGDWWVSDENNGESTLYNGYGNQGPVFTIPACSGSGTGHPTGQVFSGSTTDFKIPQESTPAPARFIFATLDGAIAAWNKTVPTANNATAEIEVCNANAKYTGITIVVNGGKKFLLLANFASGNIDCYDTTYNPCKFSTTAQANISLATTPDGTFASDAFVDTSLTADSGDTVVPFNVQAVGNLVYVTYAEKNSSGTLVTTANSGSVNSYTAQGKLVRRYGKTFNAPWGIAQAGGFFGQFSHALLIGNHGDGTINAYDPATGRSLGKLLTSNTTTATNLVINGLFALQFGNDSFLVTNPPSEGTGPATSLFFTASGSSTLTANSGFFGNLTPIPVELAGNDIY